MTESEQERKLDEARHRLVKLSEGLTVLFHPKVAANLMIYSGIRLLVQHYGEAQTKDFLQGLADEFEDAGPWPSSKSN